MHTHTLELRVNPGRANQQITELLADLALAGPLTVISGQDWLPGYALTRLLRRRTTEIQRVLRQVHLARAFTCYQVLDLLACAPPRPEPLVVVDLLHTFYSPDVPLPVRLRVLRRCVEQLERHACARPVTVFIQQVPVEEYLSFHPILAAQAGRIVNTEAAPAPLSQPALF